MYRCFALSILTAIPLALSAGHAGAADPLISADRNRLKCEIDFAVVVSFTDTTSLSGIIRPDGRMVYDMYLRQVKTPAESKYPWDYYKQVARVPGDQVFTTKAESKCATWQ